MPRHAADLEEALKKKGGLTLSQLANYDDLITDALVDRVYYWSIIRKLKANYHGCRGVREELVCKILQDHVVIEKDPIEAHQEILKLPGITKYYKGLGSEDEKEHFERHLRKYINIYLPDCPFEVATTNRYTITTAEACIKARKGIKKGEAVKYLSGIQVEMTEREEKELSSRTDFSIVVSSRRKRPSLFLGPARFANHDCDSNAKLNTTGAHGIHIVARRDIAPGEEITVTYGEDYFGIDNCECLCATCESLTRNGWDPLGPLLPEESSDEEDESEAEETPKRRGRKKMPKSAFESRSPSVLGKRKRGGETSHPARKSNNKATARAVMKSGGAFENELSARNARPSDPSGDDVLDRIFNLLSSVGARRQKEMESCGFTSKSDTGSTDKNKRSATPGDLSFVSDESFSQRMGPPTYAAGLSRRSSLDSTKSKQDMSSSVPSIRETPKHRLPMIKKERSVSSLRNVMNVEDSEADLFSIPASPSPSTKPKRGRGRPRKHPQPQEQVAESTDSSSPSPPHDSSSAESENSSQTSVETFVAGNIASNICQMLTTDAGEMDVEEAAPDVSSEEDPQATAENNAPSETPTRGRDTLRRSARKGPTDISTPPVESIEPATTASAIPPTDEDCGKERRGLPRTPGDYTLTPSLLPTPYHRWVECRNCDTFFVQSDAYLTRIACPRCERHSKLYGYHWPKTDKEGKWDREERVLDHRTIHRFIEPEEERTEKKGRRTLVDVVREREMSEREGSSEAGDGRGSEKRLRSSPRRDEGRRRLRSTM